MNIEIVKATTKQDCKICDELFAKLIKFESGLDSSIYSKTKVEGFHENMMLKNRCFLAYAKAETPIGYIFGYLKSSKGNGTTTNRVFVDSLYVDAEYRDKGVGKMLLKSFENWATNEYGDDYEVELLCLANNKKALGFYQNLGYSEVKLTLRKESNREK